MLSRKHFQSENFKQNSSSTKHEECTQTRPSLTLGEAFQQQNQCHSLLRRQQWQSKTTTTRSSNGTSSRSRSFHRGIINNRIVTVLCVAFAIATLVAQNCDATSTDSQNRNGTSDIRSIREGAAAADGSINSNRTIRYEQSSSSEAEAVASGPKQSLSPSLNSNLVAANFSNVAATPIYSSNDVVDDIKSLPPYTLGAMGKEQAMYVRQLEMNFAKLKRRIPIYQNEFAVHIPSGAEVADRIAHKYGFQNMGQVS